MRITFDGTSLGENSSKKRHVPFPAGPATFDYGSRDGIFYGMLIPMRTTIDRAGRLVVPKVIREAAHLTPGTEVEVRLVGGRVEIEPVPIDIQLERRGRLVVAVPRGPAEVLTEEEVEATMSGLRRSASGGKGTPS